MLRPAAPCKVTDGVVKEPISGEDIPLKIYHPKAGAGPFPIAVYIHGGECTMSASSMHLRALFKRDCVPLKCSRKCMSSAVEAHNNP